MTRFRIRSHRPEQLGLESEHRSPSVPINRPRGVTGSVTSSPESKVLSTLLALWPSRSSSKTGEGDCESPRISVREVGYLPFSLPVFEWDDQSPKRTTSPRTPRHVPIVIPDFAYSSALESSEPRLKSDVHKGTSPQLRRAVQNILPTNAKQCSSISPRSSKEEVRSSPLPRASPAMNNSQISLSAVSESGQENPNASNQSLSNAGLVSPISQHGPSGPNLSGLVCNVYRTTGEEPAGLIGATTTVLGDKLYVFGGRIPSRTRLLLTSDLYELDLVRRNWSKVEVSGETPPPRYFHSICALGDTKLVCYGGMSPAPVVRAQTNGQAAVLEGNENQPEVVVMSDVHIFDVPTRQWFLVAGSTAGTEGPQGRYAHCAAILPSSAVFASTHAAHSAIHHNRGGPDSHSGKLGVQLDGTGGAEMIVIGGQDSASDYIEQISVFNLRSLKWTSITPYDRKCGAYKSMAAPLVGLNAEAMGRGVALDDTSTSLQSETSMLIYSNYNFLDVKLELQVRLPNGKLVDRSMAGPVSPPGLRFPSGGIINSHFVVSGTYLTSSKHEYAVWALDLRTLTWGRIDTAGSVFSEGSWNRGILWNRRNAFLILGHRKRKLVDDYNARRINFSHICMVELEAFGLYDNPRKTNPCSSYVSVSGPVVSTLTQHSNSSSITGGRQLSNVAEHLGQTALAVSELADMELIAMGGERIPCNSRILSRRWGPFFHQLLSEATNADDRPLSETTTLNSNINASASRISAITITPASANSVNTAGATDGIDTQSLSGRSAVGTLDTPDLNAPSASKRPRSLYLPHTAPTLRLMLDYLYTSSLPPLSSPLCSPHTLCSLLQMARPYQIDGLLEATVQRLHEVLSGRNAAAVFNAAAMAAGGGRATVGRKDEDWLALERRESQLTATADDTLQPTPRTSTIRPERRHSTTESVDSSSTATSTSNDQPLAKKASAEHQLSNQVSGSPRKERVARPAWTGEISSVIGLQKRGLRGLMEGRRMRERGNTTGTTDS